METTPRIMLKFPFDLVCFQRGRRVQTSMLVITKQSACVSNADTVTWHRQTRGSDLKRRTSHATHVIEFFSRCARDHGIRARFLVLRPASKAVTKV